MYFSLQTCFFSHLPSGMGRSLFRFLTNKNANVSLSYPSPPFSSVRLVVPILFRVSEASATLVCFIFRLVSFRRYGTCVFLCEPLHSIFFFFSALIITFVFRIIPSVLFDRIVHWKPVALVYLISYK